jgi:hypothetical protein
VVWFGWFDYPSRAESQRTAPAWVLNVLEALNVMAVNVPSLLRVIPRVRLSLLLIWIFVVVLFFITQSISHSLDFSSTTFFKKMKIILEARRAA